VLIGGLLSATNVGDAPFRARWAQSLAAFENQVATLGPPGPGPHLRSKISGPCPARIGSFRIAECNALDHGYLFVQAQDAVTDVSGILYVPDGRRPASTGLDSSGFTALGGPWWAWTCYC